MCVARVEMISEHHRFADVKPDDASMLQSGSSGAQLLWIQPEEEREDPAIAWVVARLGTPPGAVAQRARLVGYSDDHDHFEGILIDEYDADVGGTSGEIFCWKYPIADEDIRKYIPPLVPNDDPQLSPHVPVVQQTVLLPGEDEPRAVWIIDGFFTLTCYDVLLSQRREVQPSPPGAPVTPTDVQQPGGPFIGR